MWNISSHAFRAFLSADSRRVKDQRDAVAIENSLVAPMRELTPPARMNPATW